MPHTTVSFSNDQNYLPPAMSHPSRYFLLFSNIVLKIDSNITYKNIPSLYQSQYLEMSLGTAVAKSKALGIMVNLIGLK